MIEEFSTEELISSLIMAGYNRVDDLLLALVLDHLNNLDFGNMRIMYNGDSSLSSKFTSFISYEDNVYSLTQKSLSVPIYSVKNEDDILVGDILPVNSTLVKYFINTDLGKIILLKASMIGINNLSNHPDLFSNKEINILKEKLGSDVFGELYSQVDKLEVEDYASMSEKQITQLAQKNKGFSHSYIYKYCLNNHQRQIANEVLSISSNYNLSSHLHKSVDGIISEYRNRESNNSILLSVCEIHSRRR